MKFKPHPWSPNFTHRTPASPNITQLHGRHSSFIDRTPASSMQLELHWWSSSFIHHSPASSTILQLHPPFSSFTHDHRASPVILQLHPWSSSFLGYLYLSVLIRTDLLKQATPQSNYFFLSVMRQWQYLIPPWIDDVVRHRPSACRYPLSLLIVGWWSVPCLPPPLSSGPSNLHHPLYHPSPPVGEAPGQCSSQPQEDSLAPLSSSRGILGASSPPHQMSGADQWRGLVQHLRLL